MLKDAFTVFFKRILFFSINTLVCPAFNADFDGDQMAVHIPLSLEAQAEARLLMLAPHNFLSPATGQPIVLPSQDMVLGCYYLTSENPTQQKGSGQYFSSLEDVIRAYEQNKIDLHAYIWVRFDGLISDDSPSGPVKIIDLSDNNILKIFPNKKIKENKKGECVVQYVRTTIGRVIFNKAVRDSLLT